MKQIVVLSGKGGTGKTTITASLVQLAKGTAIIADCDVDAPNLHLILSPQNNSEKIFKSGKIAVRDANKCIYCGECYDNCRYEAVFPNYEINEMSCEGCGVCAYVCPTKAITMEESISGTIFEGNTRFGKMVHAKLRLGAENSGKLVTAVVKQAREKAQEMDKEIVIVDGSPGIGCPVISALTGASLVIIVTEPTITAVHDMTRVKELLDHFKIPAGVITNKASINEKQRQKIIDYCKKNDILLLGQLDYNPQFYKALTNRKTILEAELDNTGELEKIWSKIKDFLEL